MKDNNTVLVWLQSWLKCQNENELKNPCEVEIETVGDLGWHVTIHVTDAAYHTVNIPIKSVEYSENDWYYYRMYNGKYEASGDSGKLELLLQQFKLMMEKTVT